MGISKHAARSEGQELSSGHIYMQFFTGQSRYDHGTDICPKRLSSQAAYTCDAERGPASI